MHKIAVYVAVAAPGLFGPVDSASQETTAPVERPSPEVGPEAVEQGVSPIPPIRQPSYVENAGNLNRNEHAVLFFVDAEVLPAAAMIGYRYGLLSWWDIGIAVGGNLGVLQALIHTKMINLKTKKTEFFWWGFTFKTGYKYHKIDWSDDFIIDDKSWIYVFENPFAFRFGEKKEKAIFVTTKFYLDQDLHSPRRQNDYYLGPAHLGFEMVIGKHTNFFVEAGVMWSINGSKVAVVRPDAVGGQLTTTRSVELKYKGDWFPVLQIGFAARTGERTARYGKIKRKKK
jgi:hypothetical protein